jgi:hypothetical protein
MSGWIVFVYPDNWKFGDEVRHYLYHEFDELLSAVHDLAANKMKYTVNAIGECLADFS